MISSTVARKRYVIPRWRPLRTALASLELAHPAKRNAAPAIKPGAIPLIKSLANWRKDRTLVNASELVESALVYGDERELEAIRAAQSIIAADSGATDLVKANAATILIRSGHENKFTHLFAYPNKVAASHWRERTRLFPQNSLAWVELSFAQVNSHATRSAERSMLTALNLAPNSRYVLRSAARFYVHIDEPEKAYDLIRRNAATPHDPWLIAAEISLAPGAGKSPAFLKKSLNLLDDFRPRQISELASAAASKLLSDGARRPAKKIFSRALADPTGNSLAQAEWASIYFAENIETGERLRHSVDGVEARAIHFANIGEYEYALGEAQKWIEEEPFSSRAYLTAASAANMLERYSLGASFIKNALSYSSSGPLVDHLKSSLVFSAACMDRLDEAEVLLESLGSQGQKHDLRNLLEANRGLIALKRNQVEKGVAHYQSAISGFSQYGMIQSERLARAYFAREAIRSGYQKSAEILKSAKEKNVNPTFADVACIVHQAEELREKIREALLT